jgi:hypothetical protein
MVSSPLSPSPPAEKATTRQDQAGQASTGDDAALTFAELLPFPLFEILLHRGLGRLGGGNKPAEVA